MARRLETIVEGVTLSKQGVVQVAPELETPLCDLAIELQEDGHAVDVEHVLAALVMAVRDGRIEAGLSFAQAAEQRETLARYVEIVFNRHGGQVSPDD